MWSAQVAGALPVQLSCVEIAVRNAIEPVLAKSNETQPGMRPEKLASTVSSVATRAVPRRVIERVKFHSDCSTWTAWCGLLLLKRTVSMEDLRTS